MIILASILDPLIDQVESELIVSSDIHLVIATLYFTLFLISIFFAYKIRKGFINSGQWNQGPLGKSFFGSVIGLSIIILNFFLSFLWLYLTDGTEILMFNEKGMVAGIGFLLFLGLFPYASLIIVHMSDSAKKIATILLWGTEIILSLALFISILSIFSIFPLNFDFVVILVLIGMAMIILLIITTILLIRESRTSFSKINKIRLQILVLGILFFIIDLSSIVITFLTRTSDPQLFVLWLHYVQPVLRFGTYTVTLSAFYLSFFFPLWLQKRTGALPPSFEQMMKKRKSMQWNKIVQREKTEQV